MLAKRKPRRKDLNMPSTDEWHTVVQLTKAAFDEEGEFALERTLIVALVHDFPPFNRR